MAKFNFNEITLQDRADITKVDENFQKIEALAITADDLPDMDFIPLDQKGAPNGVATLNSSGKVPAAQLDITPVDSIPVGGIIMWSGSIATIPPGWWLCDGTVGTPDLRDRFLVGAGNTYSPGNTGGAASHTLTTAQLPSHAHAQGGSAVSNGSHTHSLTNGSAASNGAHTHTLSGDTGNNTVANGSMGIWGTAGNTSGTNYLRTNNDSPGGASNPTSTVTVRMPAHSHPLSGSAASNGAHTHTLSGNTSDTGAHTHTLSGNTANAGSGSAHENRPPYYALAFIMKL